MTERKIGDTLWKAMQVGIIFFSILGCAKGIFISLDIDESYAVTQAYRLAIGEQLIVDMWEPHQLSAFLSAAFIKIYLLIFRMTDYLVIYLRVVGVLIHAGFAVWIYKTLKGKFDKIATFLLVFLHINFFPKWIQMPEFELMHYWFLLTIFLILYPYFSERKKSWIRPCLAGISLVGCMMSYPTMILLYPFYVIGLSVLEGLYYNANGIRRLRSVGWMTLGALISGIFFVFYMLREQTWREFWENVLCIFMDESHTNYTMIQKSSMYVEEIAEIWNIYCESLQSSAMIVTSIICVLFVVNQVRSRSKLNWEIRKKLEMVVLGILVLTAWMTQKNAIIGCLLENQNQFYQQVRYVAIIIPAVYLGIRYHKRMAIYFWLSVIPALVSIPAVLLITNMGVNVVCSKVVVGVYGSLLMFGIYLRDEMAECKLGGELLIYGLELSLLIGFFVCRLILIRVTGCLPVTIMAPMERMEYGAEKGIYILEEQAQIWNENYSILKGIVKKEDGLLFIGAENLVYPTMGCSICTPSTQGTTVFNEIFLEYYEKLPEKVPNIVVIDKTFGTNPVYRLYSDTHVVMNWIEENYPNARESETSYMKILYLDSLQSIDCD